MSIHTKINGYLHLPGEDGPDAETIKRAHVIADLLKDRLALSVIDTAPLGEDSLEVWGTHPDGTRVLVTLSWDGFVTVRQYQANVATVSAFDLRYGEALTLLHNIAPHVPS